MVVLVAFNVIYNNSLFWVDIAAFIHDNHPFFLEKTLFVSASSFIHPASNLVPEHSPPTPHSPLCGDVAGHSPRVLLGALSVRAQATQSSFSDHNGLSRRCPSPFPGACVSCRGWWTAAVCLTSITRLLAGHSFPFSWRQCC